MLSLLHAKYFVTFAQDLPATISTVLVLAMLVYIKCHGVSCPANNYFLGPLLGVTQNYLCILVDLK